MKPNESAALGWAAAALLAGTFGIQAAADHVLLIPAISVGVAVGFAYQAGRERSRSGLEDLMALGDVRIVRKDGKLVELRVTP